MPRSICGQFLEHRNLSILQKVQPSSSPHLQWVHSIVALVRDPPTVFWCGVDRIDSEGFLHPTD